jgi:hypothetical protein
MAFFVPTSSYNEGEYEKYNKLLMLPFLAICVFCYENVDSIGQEEISQRIEKIGRKRFTEKEDAILIQFAKEHGENNWRGIQQMIKDHNDKQCRDRYKRCLKPQINGSTWSREEDSLLLGLVG